MLGQKERLLERFRSFGLGHLTPADVRAPEGGWRNATTEYLTPLTYLLVLKLVNFLYC